MPRDPHDLSVMGSRRRVDLTGSGPEEQQEPEQWQEPPDSSLSSTSFFRDEVPYFDAAWLYGPAGGIVRIILPTTEADIPALYVQLLVGLGNLIGRSPHFVADGQRHGVNLFCCVVGQSGKSRKGTSWARCRGPLQQIDPEWARERVKSGIVSSAGLLEPFREREGSPPPDRRLLAVETEFSRVIKVLGKHGNSEMLRQGWDGGTLEILRRTDSITVRDAHISMIGHITRLELEARLSIVDTVNGFANRILWVHTDRSKFLPDGGTSPSLNGPLFDCLCRSVEDARTRGRVELDAEAREYWGVIYPDLSAAIPGALGEVLNRGEAQVKRLSLLLALLDGAPYIHRIHLKAALAIWRYAEASARHIFANRLGTDRDEEDMNRLYRLAFAEFGQNPVTKKQLYELIIRQEEPLFGFLQLNGRSGQTRLGIKLKSFNGRPLSGITMLIDDSDENRLRYTFRT